VVLVVVMVIVVIVVVVLLVVVNVLLGLVDLDGPVVLVDHLLLLLQNKRLVVVVHVFHHRVYVLLDLLVDGHVNHDFLLFLVASGKV